MIHFQNNWSLDIILWIFTIQYLSVVEICSTRKVYRDSRHGRKWSKAFFIDFSWSDGGVLFGLMPMDNECLVLYLVACLDSRILLWLSRQFHFLISKCGNLNLGNRRCIGRERPKMTRDVWIGVV
jgi:hypothetical protein